MDYRSFVKKNLNRITSDAYLYIGGAKIYESGGEEAFEVHGFGNTHEASFEGLLNYLVSRLEKGRDQMEEYEIIVIDC